jgi:transcriptional regulator with XRE-family HTH domain
MTARSPAEKQKLLDEDIKTIRASSRLFSGRGFAARLDAGLSGRRLSKSEFGRRLGLSHQAVSKWLSGGARPQNRETVKEIGLALNLGEGGMNDLLLSLGYTRLYPKNPLDSACIFLIQEKAAPADPLGEYRKLVELLRIKDLEPDKNRVTIPTADLRGGLGRVLTEQELKAWLRKNTVYFSSFGSTMLPKMELRMFISLFLGGDSVNSQYKNRLIPKAIRDWLYPMITGDELIQKELRDKLIAFAFFKNMNAADINFMMDLAKLRRFTFPETVFEADICVAAGLAHERFPPYEDDYLGCIIYPELEAILDSAPNPAETALPGISARQKKFYGDLMGTVKKRIETTWKRAEEYRLRQKDEAESIFEKYYTDRRGNYTRCLAIYIRDITDRLIQEGDVMKSETAALWGLLQL